MFAGRPSTLPAETRQRATRVRAFCLLGLPSNSVTIIGSTYAILHIAQSRGHRQPGGGTRRRARPAAFSQKFFTSARPGMAVQLFCRIDVSICMREPRKVRGAGFPHG